VRRNPHRAKEVGQQRLRACDQRLYEVGVGRPVASQASCRRRDRSLEHRDVTTRQWVGEGQRQLDPLDTELLQVERPEER